MFLSVYGKEMAWHTHLKSEMALSTSTDQQVFTRAGRWARRSDVPFDENAFPRYLATRRTEKPDIAEHVRRYLAFKLHIDVEPLDSEKTTMRPSRESASILPMDENKLNKQRHPKPPISAAAIRKAPRYAHHSGKRS